MKNKTKKIAIIIPTHNDSVFLIRCLDSLMRQSLKNFEIIVVDNGSTGVISNRVKNNYPLVKVIYSEINLGVARGRNIGMRAAGDKYAYLLFLDHDIVTDKGMLEGLMKLAESSNDIGIVTPKIYYWEDKKRIWSAGTGINLWTGQVLFRGGKDVGQYERIEEVQVAPAVALVKKEVIEKIGGFNEKYFATFEDTDFCFRARSFGFKTFYTPSAVAYHKLPIDPKNEAHRLLNRAYWIGRNRILFMRDYGKNFCLFLFFLPIFISYYFLISFRNSKIGFFLQFIRGTFRGLLNK